MSEPNSTESNPNPDAVIDPGLLEILACPETHQPLRLATSEELQRVNARIASGDQKNVGGEAVADAVVAGLVREDGSILYCIRDAIPVLLIDEGLPL